MSRANLSAIIQLFVNKHTNSYNHVSYCSFFFFSRKQGLDVASADCLTLHRIFARLVFGALHTLIPMPFLTKSLNS